MNVHVPGYTQVDVDCFGFPICVGVGVIHLVVAIRKNAVHADILAEGWVIFETNAIFGNGATGRNQTVELVVAEKVNLRLVLFVRDLSVYVEVLGKVKVEASYSGKVLSPVVHVQCMVDKVDIEIPTVVYQFVA